MGALDNVNHWLRRDLHRKTLREHYAAEDLDDSLWLYNTTPHECLGYQANPVGGFKGTTWYCTCKLNPPGATRLCLWAFKIGEMPRKHIRSGNPHFGVFSGLWKGPL